MLNNVNQQQQFQQQQQKQNQQQNQHQNQHQNQNQNNNNTPGNVVPEPAALALGLLGLPALLVVLRRRKGLQTTGSPS